MIGLVINDSEDLPLHANLLGNGLRIKELGIEQSVKVAEDPIIEWSLVLVWSAACAHRRVWPINFVGLTHMHALTMLEIVQLREPEVRYIILLANLTMAYISNQSTSIRKFGQSTSLQWTHAKLVELTLGTMFGPKVPVRMSCNKVFRSARVHPCSSHQNTLCDIFTTLVDCLERTVHKAINVCKFWLNTIASVRACPSSWN